GGTAARVEARNRIALRVEDAREPVDRQATERTPARPRHPDRVERRSEPAPAFAPEGVTADLEVRDVGLDRALERGRVDLELLGEVGKAARVAARAGQHDAGEERIEVPDRRGDLIVEEEIGDAAGLGTHGPRDGQALARLVDESPSGLIHED